MRPSSTASRGGASPVQPGAADDCYYCYDYNFGGGIVHEFAYNPPPWENHIVYPGVWHDDATPGFWETPAGPCWAYHYDCSGFASLQEDIKRASDAGWQPAAIVRLAARYPDVVRLNEARGAMQVVNCTGDVIANVGSNLKLADLANADGYIVATRVLSPFNLDRALGL